MSRYLTIILIGLLSSSVYGQQIRMKNRKDGEVLHLRPKKVVAIVGIDGQFYEGKPKLNGSQLLINGSLLSVSDIGFIETKKGSFKQVASFPFKLVGITSGVVGAALTTAYVSDEEEEAAVGVAGLTLLGVGVGSTLLGKRMSPASDETIRTFHVKDWEFSLE